MMMEDIDIKISFEPHNSDFWQFFCGFSKYLFVFFNQKLSFWINYILYPPNTKQIFFKTFLILFP